MTRVALCGLLSIASVAACMPVRTDASIHAAERSLARAAELGADRRAPYEYYLAREHLAQAHIEEGEAEYDDASEYALSAERYANRAAELAKAAKAKEP